MTTSAAALKPDDGDNNAYVTTLAAAPNGGLPSTVFSNGGTFYCRTRLAANDSVVSNLFTFKSNQNRYKHIRVEMQDMDNITNYEQKLMVQKSQEA